MQSLTEIRALLTERGLRPRKRYGQNFLHDHNQIGRLVRASGVGRGDLVLEVGPGTGALTEALVAVGVDLVACELDAGLAGIVRDRLGDRITLIEGDCLGRGRVLSGAIVEALGGRDFTLVANLPYQAASPLMATLLIDHPACGGQFVTIQKEVADRLVAPPGGKTYGPLGIIVQAFAEVERIANLSASCFWPAPEVTSAMVAVRRRADPLVDDGAAFARFVTTVFSKRRKQLGSIVGREGPWPEGVTADMRPERLTVGQMAELWRLGS